MSEEYNPTAGHEARDVPARAPVLFIFFMAVFVPLCLWASWLLLVTLWEEVPGPPSPFADDAVSRPSTPQLQVAPEADLAELNQRMEQQLQGVGWVDQAAGRVHLPIERAMQLLVERGLPEQDIHASDAEALAITPVSVEAASPESGSAPAGEAEPGNGQEAGNE